MPLSPYVEEPLNSKVIKSFVPEQRSRYVFFEFRDSYVLSLWTFDVRFTHSHIISMVHIYLLFVCLFIQLLFVSSLVNNSVVAILCIRIIIT